MIYLQKAIIFPLRLHFAEFTEPPAFRSFFFFFPKYDLIPQMSNSPPSLCSLEFQLRKVGTKLYYCICGEVLSVLSVTQISTFLLRLYSIFGSLSSYQRHINYHSFLGSALSSQRNVLMVFKCILMVLKWEYALVCALFQLPWQIIQESSEQTEKKYSCCTAWAFSHLAWLGCFEWRGIFMGCI